MNLGTGARLFNRECEQALAAALKWNDPEFYWSREGRRSQAYCISVFSATSESEALMQLAKPDPDVP
jgi:hypothetical protein